jgi:hypothetical protein
MKEMRDGNRGTGRTTLMIEKVIETIYTTSYHIVIVGADNMQVQYMERLYTKMGGLKSPRVSFTTSYGKEKLMRGLNPANTIIFTDHYVTEQEAEMSAYRKQVLKLKQTLEEIRW